MLQFLVEHGADVNARDVEGLSALHLAAANRRVHTLEKLVSLGVDVHAKSFLGQTALHVAAANGHVDAAQVREALPRSGCLERRVGLVSWGDQHMQNREREGCGAVSIQIWGACVCAQF